MADKAAVSSTAATVQEGQPPPTTAADVEIGGTGNVGNDEVRYAEVDESDASRFGKTGRGLTGRHVQLIILGGSVGTGLFVGIGSALARAGPLSVFLAFAFYATFVSFPLMHAVGEMCSWLPVRGSIFHFAEKWVDSALGFAIGYMYWYGAVMFVCIEMTAVAGVIGFWSDLNPGIWIALALALSVALNIFAVKYYGESEFVSSLFKIFLIIGLILLTFVTMLGGNPKGDRYGFRNWKEPGPMKEYLEHGALGRFLGFWSVLIYAAFACGGPDILMMISGEVQNPRKNIPSAAKKSYFRITLFYVAGTFCVGTICSSTDPALLAALDAGSSGSAASPWVIGIRNLNIHGLDHLVNFVVMTSAWTCGNAYVYSASRTFYALALQDKTPKLFKTCLKNGVPIYCVLLVGVISCICFLSISNSTSTVFGWFVNLGTVSFLLTYAVIFIAYLRFHAAMKLKRGGPEPYHRTPLGMQPYASWFGLSFVVLILVFNGFDVFFPGRFTASRFFTCYFGIFFLVVLFAGWKVVRAVKGDGGAGWGVRTRDIDLWSGKREIDDEEQAFLAARRVRKEMADAREERWWRKGIRRASRFWFT